MYFVETEIVSSALATVWGFEVKAVYIVFSVYHAFYLSL